MADFDQQLKTRYEQTFQKNVALTKELSELKKVLAELSKAARQAITGEGLWNPEFHGSEIEGAIALFMATHQQTKRQQEALKHAIAYMVAMEADPSQRVAALSALEAVNQALAGETIDQSIQRQKES